MKTSERVPERGLGRVGRAALTGIVLAGLFLATGDVFTAIFFVSYVVVAAVLLDRRPHNPIGWLLLLIAFAFIGTTNRPGVDGEALVQGRASAADFVNAWLGSWSGFAAFLGFAALMLVFPTGRLPGGRARGLAIALLCFGTLLVLLAAVAPSISYNPTGGSSSLTAPNPLAVLPDNPLWSLWGDGSQALLGEVALLLVALVSMVARYRNADPLVRVQLRWLLAALAFVVAGLISGLAMTGIFGDRVGGLAWIPAIVAYPTVPFAIWVAISRYHLYGIDRIISRTLSWAIVSGALALVFGVAIVGLQAVLAPFTQGQSIAVAGSTLVALAFFQPIRVRVQAALDRRFDRTRYDRERITAAFAARLRNEFDVVAVTNDLERVTVATVAPSISALWIRSRSADAAAGPRNEFRTPAA